MRINRFSAPIILLLVMIAAGEGNIVAQPFSGRAVRRTERNIAGGKRKAPKEARVREPKAATKAKREQEKREAGRKKEYKRSLKDNRKRHYSIQTEDVRVRMDQNEKDIRMRDKEKKKKQRQEARKPGSAKKKFKRN